MSDVKLSASTILGAFEEARSEIIGKAAVLTDGKAGTVEPIWLDELHGLLRLDKRPRRKMAYFNHQIGATTNNRPPRITIPPSASQMTAC